MKKIVLAAYDFFSVRKWLAWLILALISGLCALSAVRMGYSEDISAFLPSDPESEKYQDIYMRLGGQDRVAVFFKGGDKFAVMDAMDAFGDYVAERDSAGLVKDLMVSVDRSETLELLDFLSSNWPYFLDEEDLLRADSLLAVPGYVKMKLEEDKMSLNALSSAVTSRYMRTDPLGLFTPVLSRLSSLDPTGGGNVQDGYVFSADGKAGVAFLKSPFGGSETGNNRRLASFLDEAAKAVSSDQVTVSAVGGPVVAVGNADRIMKDTVICVSAALLLILLVLFFSYRRFSDVAWIALSIICGALFALGLISVFKSEISVIVLGIGAMIIGIAVNYPLHYVDHMKYRPDKRQALAEQVTPLVIGNVTTVGAFLGLLLMRAGALRDFGLVGALMLVGTILFVIFFLPVLAPGRREVSVNTLRLDFSHTISIPRAFRKVCFVLFVAVTILFAVFSGKVGFDTDMHNINYMTPSQKEGFEALTAMGASDDGFFVVSEGSTLDEALDRARAAGYTPICDFVPSAALSAGRVERWNGFVASHPSLLDDLSREARACGFATSAFQPFETLLTRDFEPVQAEYFNPVTSAIGEYSILRGESSWSVVGRSPERPEQLPESSFAFSSSDVNGRLAKLLSADFDKIGLICSLIVFFFLWLSFGSIGISLICFLPLVVGWVWILGLMGLLGLKFNIVNILLATFIFGMGDDYTIFITEGLMYEYSTGRKILHSFRNSVVLSALIMFIGIGVLVFAKHPAMKSVGLVTVIGMAVVVAMANYLPPLVFRFLTEKRGVKRDCPVTFGRLWNSFLAILFFLVAVFGFIPLACLRFWVGRDSEDKRLGYHRFLQRLSKFIIYHVPGTSFAWSNISGEDFSRPAVIVCNHQSHLDVMPLMMLSPKIVIITNDWVWNNPFYGYLIKKAEFYPASDGVETNTGRLRDLVARGYSIVIFPEGTRSDDCSIGRFHRGAVALARELGVDILPVFIHGFGHVLPKKDFMLRRGEMYMEVRERIDPTSLPEDLRAATRALRSIYVREYSSIRRERENAALCAQYVRYQYLYKGNEAASECMRTLRPDTFRKVDTLPAPEDGMVVVSNAGYGVYTLLLALSRPELSVVAYEADEEKFLVASHCSAVPSNLHYVFGEGPSAE